MMSTATGFQKYRATTKIHLGAIQQDVVEGTVVEFDGSVLKIGGQTHNIPSIAGSIKLGWLVPVADNVSRYVPKPAGVQVRPAAAASQERGKPMDIQPAMDDEVEVGTIGKTNDKRDAALAQQNPAAAKFPNKEHEIAELKARLSQLEQSDASVRMASEATVTEIDPDFDAMAEELLAEAADSNNEDARPVARLSPAKKKTLLTSASDAAREIRDLDNDTGKPLKVQKLSSTSRTNADARGGTPITATHTTGATGDVSETKSGDDLADILPDAATSGVPRPGVVEQDAKGDTRLVWDKSPQWRQRVKKALDLYGNDPASLKQIMEVEDESVVKHLKSALQRKAS